MTNPIRTPAAFVETGLATGGMVWVGLWLGPPLIGSAIQPVPALAWGIASIGAARLTSAVLRLTAQGLEWISAHTPTGKDGTALWARYADLKKEANRQRQGPFWGVMALERRKPLFIDYASNAMTVAPAGSGKGIATVIPAGFSIRNSKVFGDFKGELACVLKAPLEARGERVRILNPGGLWADRLGAGDCYNPLDLIADDLHRPGGLRDVPDDLRELAAQLRPEPPQGEGENTYWREGARRIIAFCILLEVMVEGYEATLSAVALLIEDRGTLEDNLRWVAGVDLEGKPLPEGPMPLEQTQWAQKHDPQDVEAFARLVRSQAANLLSLLTSPDSKTFDSFISDAQQALAPFAFGRLAAAMQRSTFRMGELKEAITSLFIVADASRMEAYKAYLGLIQWCAMTAIKRHPAKSNPVYFVMDEATNYKIHGLESLLTWGRAFGIRLHLIFQDLSAFERTYGKTALETLLSETEVKQFLPGQRSPKTLEIISKALGSQSVMTASLSGQTGGLREHLSEAARPLMTPDEVRRSPYGLLLVRRCLPALIDPVSYGAVQPWRKQAGINPFHGKPFLQKVRLRLWRGWRAWL